MGSIRLSSMYAGGEVEGDDLAITTRSIVAKFLNPSSSMMDVWVCSLIAVKGPRFLKTSVNSFYVDR